MTDGNGNGAEQVAAPEKVQKTLKLSEFQSSYVALAQREHNRLSAEVRALVDRANAIQGEAVATLRRAVEGSFREQDYPIPTAQVQIVNNEQGVPAALVWEEAPAEGTPTEQPAEQATEEAPAPAPAAPAVAKPAQNGKSPAAVPARRPALSANK